MKDRVLYLGDTALDLQASYLAGVMSYYGQDFNYVNSEKKCPDSLLEKDYRVMIVSDYPSSNFTLLCGECGKAIQNMFRA